MTYLFDANTSVINEVEIKNDANSALRVNVANGAANVTVTNPFPVTLINGNNTTQAVDFPKSGTSSFGELSVIQNTPDIQLDAVYGFNPDTMNIITINGASAEANAQTSMFIANSGTTAGGTGTIRSRRHLRYRPGQGAIARFTAMYTLSDPINMYGVDGVQQRAGLQIAGGGYGFGFSGDSSNNKTRTLGVVHSYGGSAEVRTLTFNTAPTGTQTVTITLNGTPFTATVHSGNTSNAAAEIASDIKANTSDWLLDQNDGIITFSGFTAGSRNGTYNISATGTGTLVNGTFTRTTPGIATTNDWTYQEDWQGNSLSTTLDPSKLNVFQIDYRWLGAGVVRFFVEDPTSGDMVMVHQQHWANKNVIPHVNNPSFKIAWTSIVTGTPAQPGVVQGASAMGAIQGQLVPTSYSKSWYAVNSTNLNAGAIYHLLSIRNPYSRSGKTNSQEIQIQDLTVSCQGNDPSIVHLFINANTNTTGKLIYNSMPNSNALQSAQIGPTMNTATDMPVCSFTVGINGTSQFDLIPYRLTLAPGDVISVAVESTGQLTRTGIGINWVPD